MKASEILRQELDDECRTWPDGYGGSYSTAGGQKATILRVGLMACEAIEEVTEILREIYSLLPRKMESRPVNGPMCDTPGCLNDAVHRVEVPATVKERADGKGWAFLCYTCTGKGKP